jgi:phosphocarrier protein HPr
MNDQSTGATAGRRVPSQMSDRATSAERDKSRARTAREVLITHVGGLHARPSIKVTKLAKRFQAKVWIALSADGPWTDAKSIARVVGIKAPINSLVYFAAEGVDGDQAVDALVSLVKRDFEDVASDDDAR